MHIQLYRIIFKLLYNNFKFFVINSNISVTSKKNRKIYHKNLEKYNKRVCEMNSKTMYTIIFTYLTSSKHHDIDIYFTHFNLFYSKCE